jgi:hypothetical protein
MIWTPSLLCFRSFGWSYLLPLPFIEELKLFQSDYLGRNPTILWVTVNYYNALGTHMVQKRWLWLLETGKNTFLDLLWSRYKILPKWLNLLWLYCLVSYFTSFSGSIQELGSRLYMK